jgi:hypothetical protein
MSNTFVRWAGLVCLALLAVVLITEFTVRVSASPSAVLDACINPGNGMMRLVDASTACHNNETRVEWNVEGPQGPQGPQGPAGSSAGGPPFTWVCAPGNYNQANNGNAELDIFNGSGTTANVAAHFLSVNGTNLAGAVVPGSNPAATYPGQTGTTTVPLASLNTMILSYETGAGTPANDNNLMATITVVSDQPVVVGYNIPFGPPQATPCSLLPK